MASAVSRTPSLSGNGYEGYLPDDLTDFGELFSEDERTGTDQAKTKMNGANAGLETAGLGIDKEVDIQKRVRDPRVKLDESRILSAKGIPELRKRAKNLKLKGKGHEFSDASRLLSMYQLWLDDLFPKARFSDALAMIEKEGHKASMHKVRMEWINEWKPRSDLGNEIDEPGESVQNGQPEQLAEPQQAGAQEAPFPTEEDIFEDLYNASPIRQTRPQEANNVPDDDELDELMAETAGVHGSEQEYRPPNPIPIAEGEDSMDMDSLDALMAEAEAAT